MNDYKQIYKEWFKVADQKALDFFKDPFTGEVEKENEISYLHATHIGGSTDAVLLGESEYAEPQDVLEKMQNLSFDGDKFVFDRGHALEPFIAEQFSKTTHLKVKEGTVLYNENYPWSIAQVDFFTEDNTPIEIKTVGFNMRDKLTTDGSKVWGKGCEFNSKGELLAEDNTIPRDYYIQCQKQMLFADKKQMYLCAWILTENRVRVYVVHRDDETIKKIIDAEIDFIFAHLIPNVPYVLNAELEEVEEGEVDAVYADDAFIEKAKELKTVNKQKNELDKRSKELTAEIKSLMNGHAEAITTKGTLICTLTKQTRRTFDAKAFADADAETYKKYLKESEISPKLTIAKGV